MRKHDVRKWLHAILDLLPVILIPVFMIYSHRHDVTERTDVEVTYKYQSNEVNTFDDLQVTNIYYLEEFEMTYDYLWHEDLDINFYVVSYENVTITYTDTNSVGMDEYFYSSFDIKNDNHVMFNMFPGSLYIYYINGDNFELSLTDNEIDTITFSNVIFYYEVQEELNTFIDICTTFNYLPQYTDYNVIESVEINDTKSSVMNVFMDDFNNSIDKYFNMGNVFNLNGVYQWFNTNIFSGNAPTVIYSIWNIALYELVMDLLFLLYGLFMWFIDIVENIMNKPFKSIK